MTLANVFSSVATVTSVFSFVENEPGRTRHLCTPWLKIELLC